MGAPADGRARRSPSTRRSGSSGSTASAPRSPTRRRTCWPSRRERDAIMRDLFDPEDGIGLSYLRQPMGASDFVKGPHYTYDDMPDGKTDFGMARFSVAHDEKQILPLLRQALRHNRNLKVMGTPWSPPAWMKTPELARRRPLHRRQALLRRLREVLREVRRRPTKRAGVPVDAVTLQNEPQNRFPFEYPGMDFRDPEEARLIKSVGPGVPEGGDRHEDPRLRPQLVAAPQRRRAAGGEPGVREGAARRPGGQALAGRHRLPLLLGRPELAVGAARRAPGPGHLLHRVLRASSPATRRRRSRTRCTGTRAS